MAWLKRGLYLAGLGLVALWLLFGMLIYLSRFVVYVVNEHGDVFGLFMGPLRFTGS